VLDKVRGRQFCDDFDHVFLALPLKPLRRLSEPFPHVIRNDLYAVFGFPLLKAFLVTDKPWWKRDTPRQSGAGAVPTRELHYWTAGQAQAVGAKPADGTGLVLLYTDHPATEYWRSFVQSEVHDCAGIDESPDLRRALVRLLLVEAKLLANRLLEESIKTVDEAPYARDVENWANELALGADAPLADVADRLRHTATHGGIRADVALLMTGSLGISPEMASVLTESHELTEAELLESVHTYGIRDWAREPFGAGCHAWAIGARSWEVLERIKAFWLSGAESNECHGNVHICGEAISDYQGFIEGALRTSRNAVATV
jgi:hypothetical protein